MNHQTELSARTVDRVVDKVNNGPTAQTDSSAVIIAPDFPNTDPFIVMAEDWFSSPGFDWHPHRGIETVTLVLDGVLEHGDSLGNAGMLEPGDVQWMTAGHGVIHRELAFRDERAHIMQLWINLPADRKLIPTNYQDLRAGIQASHAEPGVEVRVISGSTATVTGPAANQWPILALMLILDPSTVYRQMLPANHRAFAHVVSGRLSIAGRQVRAGQTAWSDPVASNQDATTINFVTPDRDEQTRVLFFAGQPQGEQIFAGGPFVMTSRAEIEQAFRDYHTGKFGQVPRLGRIRDS